MLRITDDWGRKLSLQPDASDPDRVLLVLESRDEERILRVSLDHEGLFTLLLSADNWLIHRELITSEYVVPERPKAVGCDWNGLGVCPTCGAEHGRVGVAG